MKAREGKQVGTARGSGWPVEIRPARVTEGRPLPRAVPTVMSMGEWALRERRAREAALSSPNRLGYWRWEEAGSYYGVPLVNFAGWSLTALVACRIDGVRENSHAGLVGAAIMLFFALLALAHSLPCVALAGFALCLAPSIRPAAPRRARTPGS